MKEYTKEEIKIFANLLTDNLMKYFSTSQNLNPEFFKKNMKNDIYKFLVKLLK